MRGGASVLCGELGGDAALGGAGHGGEGVGGGTEPRVAFVGVGLAGALAVEQGEKPMSIVVTAGQRGDWPQFEPVLEKVRVPRIGPAARPPRSSAR
ncbi:hypothetical protein ACFRQM_50050 [Streptomyces sp. NPDC056831]|uniref:hypothetical protein n=1 Tax=Streptomyces sp. NPDC056831 TaxID=3345954 RepID=UPI003675C31B